MLSETEKLELQVGYNKTSKRFVISLAGQGQVELTLDQVDEVLDLISRLGEVDEKPATVTKNKKQKIELEN